MADEYEKVTRDNYQEHDWHIKSQTPDVQCSECWKWFHNHDCKMNMANYCPTCALFANQN